MTMVREGLLGPSYLYHRRLIERSRGWSADQIREYQETRVRRLTRSYGDEITGKDDYRQDPRRYTRWDMPGLTHMVRTGGTSGQPLRFKADTLARRQKERAYLFDIWSRVGYAPHDLRVVYRGNVQRGLVRFDRLENAWIISPSATVDRQLDGLRRWVRTLPPFYLHVYPSSLFTFIDLVGEGLFRSLPVRGVLAGSEAFPLGEQEKFEKDFDIRIAHWYGHSEYAVLAYCCRNCGGFHFYPTYGHVELLASDTEGCLRIIASSFNRVGTQFVRYDTGDLAVAAPGRSCPDPFPRIGGVVGRSEETFIDGSGRRRALGPYVFGLHGPFWDQIRDLQFVQDRPGSLLVRLVANPRADSERIERTLERRMPMVRLTFEYVPAIARGPNGKRRYFVPGSLAESAPQPGELDREPRPRKSHRPRWIAAASMVLAAVLAVMSFMIARATADRSSVARLHRHRVPIVNVKDQAPAGSLPANLDERPGVARQAAYPGGTDPCNGCRA
jgi:phenylacetate-CoA ligase